MSTYTDRVATNRGLWVQVMAFGTFVAVCGFAAVFVPSIGAGRWLSAAVGFAGLLIALRSRSSFHVRVENDTLTLRSLWVNHEAMVLSGEPEFGYSRAKIPWVRQDGKKLHLFPLATRYRLGASSEEVEAMLREFGLDGDE